MPDFLGNIGSGFSSAFDWAGKNATGISGIGTLAGGLGSIYGAYNANQLGKQSIDLTKQQNQLLMDQYNNDNARKDSLNNSFATVWGK